MDFSSLYHSEIPEAIAEICESDEMQRLKHVGMNCGCEYTNFTHFRHIGAYSRYSHSLGVALIIYHHTGSLKQSIAGLLHDISTPVFAHVIDFLHNDHMHQEYTEGRTEEIIKASEVINRVLLKNGISLSEVSDYHIYPLADNNSPMLCADRLEYTLGNLVNYSFGVKEDVHRIYSDIVAGKNEHGSDELIFRTAETAYDFAKFSLECSKVYVCDEDRYSMQMLAELLRDAIDSGVVAEDELYTTEPQFISKLTANSVFSKRWEKYISYSTISTKSIPFGADPRVIYAKKRFIDPYIEGHGRVSSVYPAYREALDRFLEMPQDYPVFGI